ncbi:hypothetical protein KQI48_08275 [Cellulomonas hominis]|uniref:hypothetical protein n=1 Tax=Cellulomonas hominis TaxID=156981 RepID=UPI001C116513|nr:hypothetical protein [Cellulomonas hominis]MBU5422658.1 hypothetical protein [Cellulomonas hominis]
MSPAVVFLPDTALLVPGAAGRADPAAALREAAVAAVREASGVTDGPVLVVAPARRAGTLTHPVATGLGAAGLAAPSGPDRPAARADVPASVALVLLRAAGVSAPVDVVEVPRAAAEVPVLPPGAALLVVVGSPSARQGVDAPLAEDPRAAEVDAALLAGLAGGPAALASALVALGPRDAAALAVSGWAPWSAALAALGDEPVRVAAHVPAVVAGAPHCVTAWLPARPQNHPEETR